MLQTLWNKLNSSKADLQNNLAHEKRPQIYQIKHKVENKLLTNQFVHVRKLLNTEFKEVNKTTSRLVTVVDSFEHAANNQQQNITEWTALFKAELSFYLLKEPSNLTL